MSKDTSQSQTTSRTHDLKVWPEFWSPLETGEKTFDVRKDDRGFHAGDVLLLREWTQAGGYTGREMRKVVTYLLAGLPWFQRDYVCMSIKDVTDDV